MAEGATCEREEEIYRTDMMNAYLQISTLHDYLLVVYTIVCIEV
jgi:hypothetical protein